MNVSAPLYETNLHMEVCSRVVLWLGVDVSAPQHGRFFEGVYDSPSIAILVLETACISEFRKSLGSFCQELIYFSS
jgi:hypothetical protein